jgi:hypothetical protein
VEFCDLAKQHNGGGGHEKDLLLEIKVKIALAKKTFWCKALTIVAEPIVVLFLQNAAKHCLKPVINAGDGVGEHAGYIHYQGRDRYRKWPHGKSVYMYMCQF